ncbi:adenylyl cyclase [Streptomyces boninensis]|uniref:adenylyl cyclase n=1 Tax=Streptomyces boninensis TaxID=2039455 RepID=UPI003B223E1D
MPNQSQAVFLNVDVAALREQLTARGATQNLARKLLKRLVYDGAGPADAARIQLRDEGHDVTLTLWWNYKDPRSVERKVHIETGVSDLRAMAEFLMTIGLHQWLNESHYREEWQLDDVLYGFETWPDLPDMLVLDGPDAETVRAAVQELGLDPAQGRSQSVAEIYRTELGRDINARYTSTRFTDPERA